MSPLRPTRIWNPAPKQIEEPKESDEMKLMKAERAARLAKIVDVPTPVVVAKPKEDKK